MKKQMRSVFHKSGDARKFLRSFIVFFLIPFIIISVTILINMSSTFNSLAVEEQLISNISILDHLEEWNVTTERIITQIICDNDFKVDLLSYVSVQSATQIKLQLLAASQNGLENIWLLIPDEQRFISGTDSLTIDRLNKTRFKILQSDNTDTNADIYNRLVAGEILSVTDLFLGRQFLLIPSSFRDAINIENKNTMVVFQISMQQIYTELNSLLSQKDGAVRLRNASGDVLCQIQNGSCPAEAFTYCTACNKTSVYNTCSQITGNKLYSKNISTSVASEKWAVDIIISSNILARYHVTQTTFLLLFAVLVLGSSVCVFLTIKAFKPIVTLRNSLTDVEPSAADDSANDYEYIESSIEQICADNKQLNLSIASNHRRIIDFISSQLFSGRIADLEELRSVYNFDIPMPTQDTFIIAAFEANGFEKKAPVETLKKEHILTLRFTSGNNETLLIFPNENIETAIAGASGICRGSGDFSQIPVCCAKAWFAASLEQIEFSESLYEYSCTMSPDVSLSIKRAIKHSSIDEIRDMFKTFSTGTVFSNFIALCGCTLQTIDTKERVKIDDATIFYHKATDSISEFEWAWDNLCALLESYVGSTDEVEKNDKLEEIYQYIATNYDAPDFSIKQMANDFSMSISTLSNYFKSHANILLSDYITEMRMKKAQHLLKTSNLTIQEVALAVGYFNANSFVRRFHQIFGRTPTEYREKG